MNVYGVRYFREVTADDCFIKEELPTPTPGPRDVLVQIRAIAINPVDTKVRAMQHTWQDPVKILGWDASGVITAIGKDVLGFQIGDEVYYAGDISRPGCYAEFQCVDHRIIAHKPKSLSFAEAASLPLTALTAWEGLHDRMRVSSGKSLLIIGGAGGVGSIAIQLAKLAGLHVTATASRKESADWCRRLGADAVIDHSENMVASMSFDYIANFVNTEAYWDKMGEWIAPQGSMLLIVEPRHELRLGDPLKAKCVSIHWEFMFARSRYQTSDIHRQGEILRDLAALVDAGKIQHTMHQPAGIASTRSLAEAHGLIESGKALGKIVLTMASSE